MSNEKEITYEDLVALMFAVDERAIETDPVAQARWRQMRYQQQMEAMRQSANRQLKHGRQSEER